MHAVLCGEVDQDDASYVIGTAMKHAVSGQGRDETRHVARLAEVLGDLTKYPRGKAFVSENARAIAQAIALGALGSRVVATTVSSEEIVRGYRLVTAPKSVRPDRVESLGGAPTVAYPAAPVQCEFPRLLTRAEKTAFDLGRNAGNCATLCSGALSLWGPLSFMFKGKSVLVIGSGLGACAASAIIGGAEMVYGHDLRDDFPVGISLRDYVPPIVQWIAAPSRYVQTSSTVTTSGDWFEVGVPARILSEMRAPDILVLDIPASGPDSVALLSPLGALGYIGTVAVRVVGTRGTLYHLIGTMSQFSSHVELYVGYESLGIVEAVVIARPTVPVRVLATGPKSPSECFKVSGFRVIDSLSIIVTWLIGPLGSPIGQTVRSALQMAFRVFKSFRSTRISRPTHDEWTSVLVSAVTIELLLLFSPTDYCRAVLEIAGKSSHQMICVPTVVVAVTPRLIRVLTAIGARVLGHMDEKV